MKRTITIVIGVICVVCAAMIMGGCIGSSDIGSVGQSVIGSNHLTIVESHDDSHVFSHREHNVVATVRNDGNIMFHDGDAIVTFYDKNMKQTGRINDFMVCSMYPGETTEIRTSNNADHLNYGDRSNVNAVSYKIEIIHQIWGDVDPIDTAKLRTTATGKINVD